MNGLPRPAAPRGHMQAPISLPCVTTNKQVYAEYLSRRESGLSYISLPNTVVADEIGNNHFGPRLRFLGVM